MKNLLTGILILGTVLFSVRSEAQQDSTSAFHIGFMYPMSTNGKAAGQIVNHFSLHFLTGYSKGETGAAISGLANIIRENAGGVQIAGIVNHTGHNATGVQVAGIGNYVRDTASGLQVAGVYNLAGTAHSQVAGVLNISKKDVRGVQVSGFANRAENVHSQIGGFINIARRVKGVQLSGFLNIADSSDYAIGVINLIRNGEKGLGASIDETMTTTLAFRSGGRRLYSIIGVGYNRRPSGSEYLALEGGIGTNWNFNPTFRLKGEIVSRVLTADFDDDTRQTVSLRIMPAAKIANRVEIFGGPTLNYAFRDKEDDHFPLPEKYLWSRRSGDDFHGIYIGWTAGLQVLF